MDHIHISVFTQLTQFVGLGAGILTEEYLAVCLSVTVHHLAHRNFGSRRFRCRLADSILIRFGIIRFRIIAFGCTDTGFVVFRYNTFRYIIFRHAVFRGVVLRIAGFRSIVFRGGRFRLAAFGCSDTGLAVIRLVVFCLICFSGFRNLFRDNRFRLREHFCFRQHRSTGRLDAVPFITVLLRKRIQELRLDVSPPPVHFNIRPAFTRTVLLCAVHIDMDSLVQTG